MKYTIVAYPSEALVFETHEEASAEARLRADLHQGPSFFVAQIVAVVSPAPPTAPSSDAP